MYLRVLTRKKEALDDNSKAKPRPREFTEEPQHGS